MDELDLIYILEGTYILDLTYVYIYIWLNLENITFSETVRHLYTRWYVLLIFFKPYKLFMHIIKFSVYFNKRRIKRGKLGRLIIVIIYLF